MNDWLDGAFALPTRDGQDVGGAQERTMLTFAQGATGIRTVEELNPDGTITTLRTRYGRPSAGTSRASRKGIQYSRISLPIGVPAPTRTSNSLSSWDSMFYLSIDPTIDAMYHEFW